MKWAQTSIPDHYVFEPVRHSDQRGTFHESYVDDLFADVNGFRLRVAQTNVSVSEPGVLRGLHFRRYPAGRVIYVTCVHGAAFDVAVDLRVGSDTFGRWAGCRLDAANGHAVSISHGLAHGFLALAPETTMLYLCSERYSPLNEFGIDPFDPDIGISWPRTADNGTGFTGYIQSEKDQNALRLADAKSRGLLPFRDASDG